ncbi:MAG: HAD family hydrolase [Actinomycetota bacterium]
MTLTGIRAVVFDKDGTLIDVHQTWGPAMALALTDLVDDPDTRGRAAATIGVDLDTHELDPDGAIIAASNDQIIELLTPVLEVDPVAFLPVFEERLYAHAGVSVRPLPDVAEVLDAVQAMGLWIGLATNDGESSARQQLDGLGWLDRFESIVGYDSGFGAKPGPGMLLASAARAGVEPHELLLVGDTDTDLRTAAAAGCPSVLVHAPIGSVTPTVHLDRLRELPDLLRG